MTTYAIKYLDLIDRLPPGATLRVPAVPWDEYEALLAELADRSNVRVTYDRGTLEIMSPLPEHEEYGDLIQDLTRVLAEELGIKLETRGSATFKRSRDKKGVEPDESFYVQNADRIIGKRKIDLNVDPPPDIVVEIDITNESRSKFPLYASLAVPEIWLYDSIQAHIYQLQGSEYVKATVSRFFTLITPEVLARFIEQAAAEGQSATLLSFRQWVREQIG
ncbi:MAG TPA: Uma2 family endonuclease [Blastocatellia bacterium]|nr:Uma2 family endonuclease [Blastocatellia bacterium]